MRVHYSAEKFTFTMDVDSDFVDSVLQLVREGRLPSVLQGVGAPRVEDEPDSLDSPDKVDESDDLAFSPMASVPEAGLPPAPEAVDKEGAVYATWYKFIRMWLVNYDQEGDQPDRGVKTRGLAHSRKAGALCRLIRQLGGTTHAVYDAVTTAALSAESARLDGMTDAQLKQISRAVAENITQVSSVLFSDMSDLLEYHNPFDEEEL
jgi:hypothetical protein